MSKQSGWDNSPSNTTGGKVMHIFFYRNNIFLKSGIPFNRHVMLLQSELLFFLLEVVSYSNNSTTYVVVSFPELLKDYLYEKPQHVFMNNFI